MWVPGEQPVGKERVRRQSEAISFRVSCEYWPPYPIGIKLLSGLPALCLHLALSRSGALWAPFSLCPLKSGGLQSWRRKGLAPSCLPFLPAPLGTMAGSSLCCFPHTRTRLLVLRRRLSTSPAAPLSPSSQPPASDGKQETLTLTYFSVTPSRNL